MHVLHTTGGKGHTSMMTTCPTLSCTSAVPQLYLPHTLDTKGTSDTTHYVAATLCNNDDCSEVNAHGCKLLVCVLVNGHNCLRKLPAAMSLQAAQQRLPS
jgi:hypothetical protein